MFSWDRMVLSKILDFDNTIEEDFPLSTIIGSDFGMVLGTFSFILNACPF